MMMIHYKKFKHELKNTHRFTDFLLEWNAVRVAEDLQQQLFTHLQKNMIK